MPGRGPAGQGAAGPGQPVPGYLPGPLRPGALRGPAPGRLCRGRAPSVPGRGDGSAEQAGLRGGTLGAGRGGRASGLRGRGALSQIGPASGGSGLVRPAGRLRLPLESPRQSLGAGLDLPSPGLRRGLDRRRPRRLGRPQHPPANGPGGTPHPAPRHPRRRYHRRDDPGLGRLSRRRAAPGAAGPGGRGPSGRRRKSDGPGAPAALRHPPGLPGAAVAGPGAHAPDPRRLCPSGADAAESIRRRHHPRRAGPGSGRSPAGSAAAADKAPAGAGNRRRGLPGLSRGRGLTDRGGAAAAAGPGHFPGPQPGRPAGSGDGPHRRGSRRRRGNHRPVLYRGTAGVALPPGGPGLPGVRARRTCRGLSQSGGAGGLRPAPRRASPRCGRG